VNWIDFDPVIFLEVPVPGIENKITNYFRFDPMHFNTIGFQIQCIFFSEIVQNLTIIKV
jgi:hypothetical protein